MEFVLNTLVDLLFIHRHCHISNRGRIFKTCIVYLNYFEVFSKAYGFLLVQDEVGDFAYHIAKN